MRNANKARPVLGMVVSLTLLISLSTYGVRAYTRQVKPTQAKALHPVSTQAAFDHITEGRERFIVGQLGLSPDQQRQYDALRNQQKEKTHAFRTRRPFRPEEGMELNAWWNNSLRDVFTPEQYHKYREAWNIGDSSPTGDGAYAPARAAL